MAIEAYNLGEKLIIMQLESEIPARYYEWKARILHPLTVAGIFIGKTERRKHSEHLHYLDKTYFASSLEAKTLCPSFFPLFPIMQRNIQLNGILDFIVNKSI